MALNDQLSHVNKFVKSFNITSTGVVDSAEGILRGMVIRGTNTGGSVVFKDGGSGGTIILTIDTPAKVDYAYTPIPGAGLVYRTNLYAELTNVDGLTVFVNE